MSKSKSSKRGVGRATTAISPRQVLAFRRRVYSYYSRHARAFPWRDTRDPYAIVVSEIMLQQTQTSRVAQRYEGFLRKFPTFKSLAKASIASVLAEWQGLGYNRRALYLVKLAQVVVQQYHGKLPSTITELRQLPGVGAYTAGALLAFVYDKPSVCIETNIRAVFLEEFFKGRYGVRDSDVATLVELTLDRKNPRRWYYALMDYGVACKERSRGINARSAHYVRQSPFDRSVRKVRGEIVKALLQGGGRVSTVALKRIVRCDTTRFSDAVASLISDNIVCRSGAVLEIAKG